MRCGARARDSMQPLAERPLRYCGFDPAAPAAELLDHRLAVLAVQLADHLDRDLLRAGGLALAVVGAAAEPLGVHLADHAPRPVEALGLALRQQVEVRDLGAGEQHRGAVRAGGDAGAAADADRGVHRLGLDLGMDRHASSAPASGPAVTRDVAAGLDDPVERRAIGDQVAHAPVKTELRNGSTVISAPSGNSRMKTWQLVTCFGPCGIAVDRQRAGAADPLAAVAVEGDRPLALVDQALVEDVEHLEERGVGVDLARPRSARSRPRPRGRPGARR